MSTPIQIDYYFSVISPWAYLGNARLHDLAKRANAQVVYHPQSSPDLFPATGGLALKDRAQPRKDYRLVELARWSKHLGIALNLQPKHFPTPEASASKMILATQDAGQDAAPLLGAIFKAVWSDELDINDPDALIMLADKSGLNGKALLEASSAARFDTAFAETTQAAIKCGVFGYPTYAYNDELFWGQDRLSFLEDALNVR